ncbi:MAG: CBS domain-containing protein [Gemmatimonadota bacterium]
MPLVRDILARKGSETVTAAPNLTVLEAAQLMNARGIGALLILDGGELVGIFTERDVMRRVVAEQRDPARTTIGDVMTRHLVTTRAEVTVEECASQMTARRIRHLPVIGETGLAGVITIGDLLAWQVAEQAVTIAQLNSFVYDNR